MESTRMRTHLEPRIPGALQRVPRDRGRLATYLVSKPVPVPQPASTQKSDITGNALSFWQAPPMAFAARKHLEEP